jgi:hypothetical protein
MALQETEVSTILHKVSFNTVDNLGVTPFFIKIDVEGAELDVLKGSLSVIKKYNPVILVEIQNHKSYQEIQELLSSYRYINIDPSKKSADSMSKVAMSRTSDFERGTNNYVWINPENPISWDFR